MKVTFYSNFLNHHQLPLSEEFIKMGIDYTFVATEPIPSERVKLGYEDMNKSYPFVLTTYDSEKNKEKALELCRESDLVILGSAPSFYLKERLKQNKITFRYSERLHKQGWIRMFDPILLYKMFKNNFVYRNKNFYLLAASAYAPTDYSKYHVFKNKMFKWGYFPKVNIYDIDELIKKKRENKKIKILWCGRLIGWKHPELNIELARKLVSNGYDFELNIIGTGKMQKKLESMIKKYNLNEYVKLIGAVPSTEVREYMEQANIFLFTSDFNEGWGAVLNESMNSGCAVVASHAIGSVPFLINKNENGLIYCNNDFNDFYNCVEKLLKEEKLREKLGINAYNTLIKIWNPANAAEKIVSLYKKLNSNKKIETYKNEPTAIAEPILQSKMYEYIVKEVR